MSLSVPVAPWLYALFAGIVVVTVVSAVLSTGSRTKKLASMIVAVVVIGIVAYFVLQPAHFSAGEDGVTWTGFGSTSFDWDRVDEARHIADLEGSPYRPVVRINGAGMGSYQAGLFRLANEQTARIFLTQSREAVLFTVSGETYLVGPEPVDEFVDIVGRYVELETLSP